MPAWPSPVLLGSPRVMAALPHTRETLARWALPARVTEHEAGHLHCCPPCAQGQENEAESLWSAGPLLHKEFIA